MKIAVEGCAHGELENIYNTIELIEKREEIKVDLLLCCGDFQATRNANDLNCMAVPKKYQHICTFYKYYSGEKKAPILTIFIGGNHEASNYLQELPYGGWVAPNIFYLGYAGVVNINGIRIAGISGIYKGFDFHKGRFEFAPYNDNTKRSVYHVRQLDVFRLKQLTPSVDIMLSHDWPRGCYNYGNVNRLLRFKPHFRDDISNNKLGSPPLEDTLKTIKPKYWFAAHLHCKFSAIIPHSNENDSNEKRHEIKKDVTSTKFLALDKCLPKRRFLQIVDIETADNSLSALKLSYDLEWLAILQSTNHLISAKSTITYMPGPSATYRSNFNPTDKELQSIKKIFSNNLEIPLNFCRTVEPYNPNQSERNNFYQPKAQLNPQTTTFCQLLGIDDPLSLAMLMSGHELNNSNYIDTSIDEEIDSTFNTSSEMTPIKKPHWPLSLPTPKTNDSSGNPDELLLDESDSDNNGAEATQSISPARIISISSDVLNSTVSSSFYPSDTLESSAISSTDQESTNSTADNLCNILQQSSKLDVSVGLEEKIIENSPKRMADFEYITTTTTTTTTTATTIPVQNKKFKRRNQSIYATPIDD